MNELRREIRELIESSLVQRDVANALLQIGSDYEKQLTQLVGYSITGESDHLDLLQRIHLLERRINKLEEE
jgi:CHASE3 domain sensor protein